MGFQEKLRAFGAEMLAKEGKTVSFTASAWWTFVEKVIEMYESTHGDEAENDCGDELVRATSRVQSALELSGCCRYFDQTIQRCARGSRCKGKDFGCDGTHYHAAQAVVEDIVERMK